MDLFPALPRDLGLQCLLRVPYTSHNNIAGVCRSWQAAVNNPQFYEDRQKLGISQQCICLIELRQYRYSDAPTDIQFVIHVYDPLQGTCETLPRLPHFPGHHHGIPLHCHCVCVKQKLVLIGGWDPDVRGKLYTVFIYDFSSARWSRGSNMPLVTISDACSVSPEGLIYVAGGTEDDETALREAAVYNVEEDEWKLLPDMSQERDRCFGVFIHGKFIVIGGFNAESVDGLERNVEVYDPEKGAWSTLQNMWTVRNGERPRRYGCAVGSSDGLFCWFQNEQGVMVYDSKENVWRAAGSLPETLGTINCCVAWRDSFFVEASAEGTGRDNFFYMLKPSQQEFFGEWDVIPITMPQHSHVDCDQFFLSAITFEI